MSTSGRKKERHSEEVLDGAILVAKITKDVGDISPLLEPLKVAMGSLITMLENAKVSQ
jgi:hypothetical protein